MKYHEFLQSDTQITEQRALVYNLFKRTQSMFARSLQSPSFLKQRVSFKNLLNQKEKDLFQKLYVLFERTIDNESLLDIESDCLVSKFSDLRLETHKESGKEISDKSTGNQSANNSTGNQFTNKSTDNQFADKSTNSNYMQYNSDRNKLPTYDLKLHPISCKDKNSPFLGLVFLQSTDCNTLKMLVDKGFEVDRHIFGLEFMPTYYYHSCVVNKSLSIRGNDSYSWLGVPKSFFMNESVLEAGCVSFEQVVVLNELKAVFEERFKSRNGIKKRFDSNVLGKYRYNYGKVNDHSSSGSKKEYRSDSRANMDERSDSQGNMNNCLDSKSLSKDRSDFQGGNISFDYSRIDCQNLKNTQCSESLSDCVRSFIQLVRASKKDPQNLKYVENTISKFTCNCVETPRHIPKDSKIMSSRTTNCHYSITEKNGNPESPIKYPLSDPIEYPDNPLSELQCIQSSLINNPDNTLSESHIKYPLSDPIEYPDNPLAELQCIQSSLISNPDNTLSESPIKYPLSDPIEYPDNPLAELQCIQSSLIRNKMTNNVNIPDNTPSESHSVKPSVPIIEIFLKRLSDVSHSLSFYKKEKQLFFKNKTKKPKKDCLAHIHPDPKEHFITLLDLFCIQNRTSSIISLLKSPNMQCKDSTLCYLLQTDTQITKHLINSRINVYQSYNSTTPLHMACVMGNIELVCIYLELGLDPSSLDAFGNDAFHLCLINGFLDVYLILTSKGTDNLRENFGGRKSVDYYFEWLKDFEVTQSLSSEYKNRTNELSMGTQRYCQVSKETQRYDQMGDFNRERIVKGFNSDSDSRMNDIVKGFNRDISFRSYHLAEDYKRNDFNRERIVKGFNRDISFRSYHVAEDYKRNDFNRERIVKGFHSDNDSRRNDIAEGSNRDQHVAEDYKRNDSRMNDCIERYRAEKKRLGYLKSLIWDYSCSECFSDNNMFFLDRVKTRQDILDFLWGKNIQDFGKLCSQCSELFQNKLRIRGEVLLKDRVKRLSHNGSGLKGCNLIDQTERRDKDHENCTNHNGMQDKYCINHNGMRDNLKESITDQKSTLHHKESITDQKSTLHHKESITDQKSTLHHKESITDQKSTLHHKESIIDQKSTLHHKESIIDQKSTLNRENNSIDHESTLNRENNSINHESGFSDREDDTKNQLFTDILKQKRSQMEKDSKLKAIIKNSINYVKEFKKLKPIREICEKEPFGHLFHEKRVLSENKLENFVSLSKNDGLKWLNKKIMSEKMGSRNRTQNVFDDLKNNIYDIFDVKKSWF